MKYLITIIYLSQLILTEPIGIEFSDPAISDTLAFWTPERIERALSNPLFPINNERNKPYNSTLKKNCPIDNCPSNQPLPNPIKGDSSQYPWIGKLLVYRGTGKNAQEWSCSASVVRSPGGKLISSAGHCIIDDTGKAYERPMFYLQYGPGQEKINSSWPINGAWWEKCYAAKPGYPNVWDYSWLRTKDVISTHAGGGLVYPNDVQSDLLFYEFGYPGNGNNNLYECHAKLCTCDYPLFPPCQITGRDMSFSLGCKGMKLNHGMSGGPVVGWTTYQPDPVIAGVMSYMDGVLGWEKQYWTYLGTSARATYEFAVKNGA